MFNKMKFFSYIVLISTFISLYSIAEARSPVRQGSPVRVDIVNDGGRAFRLYPVNSGAHNIKRAYLQATNRQQYNIKIRNMSGRRVAVVVTVDGRNILTGKKSWLRSNEKMYLVDPYQTAIYKGWRTSKNRVNRFFFTDAGNSYAGAWGDRSAMGVIAVAVFNEKPRPVYNPPMVGKSLRAAPAPMAAPKAAMRRKSKSSNAGTGYGRGERSDSSTVEFTAQNHPVSKYFYKYEWRNKLCKRGVITCNRPQPKKKPKNRFWKDDNRGYAPPPPR